MSVAEVTVFGGGGFIGRYVVQRLAHLGARVVVAQRRPNDAHELQPLGNVGQIVPLQTNIRNEASVARAVAHADTVINLVGILAETGAQKFAAVQDEGAERVARLARQAGARNLVQLSAIGADAAARSAYARTKAAGEAAVREHFPDAVVLRPSLVFGPEDQFFNRFAALAQIAPCLPLIGGGRTKFQPVYVGDVADAVIAALQDPQARGKTFELGGPEVKSFRELLELMFEITGRRKPLLNIPFGLAEFLGMGLQYLPGAPLTADQVLQLEQDNVVTGDLPGLAELGLRPSALGAVLPSYLDRFRPGGRFAATGQPG